jgi:hypothetical protein
VSYLKTVDDLRADALFRAGESPTDANGSLYTKALDYLNRIQQMLVLGGGVAVGRDLATSAGIYAHLVDIPITDWWWARKRGVFNTAPALERTTSGGIAQNGTSFSVTATITTDIVGHYVVVVGQPTVYRATGTMTSGLIVNLDAAYADDTITSGDVKIAKIEYDLAPDFLRFCSTPYAHGAFGAPLDVSSLEQRNTEWPLAQLRQGRPTSAFMVGPRTLAFNSYDTRPYRVEYEYIAMSDDLAAGTAPMLPLHHRAVLSAGASMLMLFDKGDSRAANMASEYRELVQRMVQEHRRAIGGGSSTFGQFRVRQPSILRRSPQTMGEIYLI